MCGYGTRVEILKIDTIRRPMLVGAAFLPKVLLWEAF
jgi:hypothetical protein